MALPHPPHRRRLQFGLRTALLMMLGLCIALGWLAHRISQRRHQIADLHAIGVGVEVASRFPLPTWLQSLLGDDLMAASYSASMLGGVTDEQLEKLEELPALQNITLGYSHSDAYSKVQSDLTSIHRRLPHVQQTLAIKGDR